ncbi:MAG: ATP-dependent Clp protease ATP-binding subunit ClpX [Eubacteriales bacterium]|nr:ATP-dependent Clp protease ATP-binding subunit ClpX [Eubacteriales bacterium]
MSDFQDNNNNHTQEYCFVCRRSEQTAGKMIHMPNHVTICSDCMQKMMDAASQIDFRSLMNNPEMMQELNRQLWQQTQNPNWNQNPSVTGAENQDGGTAAPQNGNGPQPERSAGTSPEGNGAQPGTEAAGQSEVISGEEENPGQADPEKEQKEEKSGPTISFLNLGDIFGNGMGMNGMAAGRQPAPKKKKDGPKPVFSIDHIPAPHLIKEKLDEYVIGQEQAKRIIAVAVYNHYKRVATGTMDDIEIEKSNILMIGPTGSGKTYLVKTLARLLDVPLAITDATSLTEAGYIGDDIESVISKLLAAADNDLEKAEKGIVFIDEIDKIAKKKNINSRDVSGEAVQQGMLKLLEGADVEVPVGANSKNAMVPLTTVNTKNILFICGGAFPDLENIVKERLTRRTSLGFNAELKDKYDKDTNILGKVTNEDLRRFGMIPEFIGRLPIVCTLQGLDTEMLVKILKEPRNAILKQYQKLLELDEVKLEFEDGALEAIAEKALKKDTGARALRAIIEEFMLDIMYEIPKDENIGTVTITKAYVEGKGGPKIEIRSESEHAGEAQRQIGMQG